MNKGMARGRRARASRRGHRSTMSWWSSTRGAAPRLQCHPLHLHTGTSHARQPPLLTTLSSCLPPRGHLSRPRRCCSCARPLTQGGPWVIRSLPRRSGRPSRPYSRRHPPWLRMMPSRVVAAASCRQSWLARLPPQTRRTHYCRRSMRVTQRLLQLVRLLFRPCRPLAPRPPPRQRRRSPQPFRLCRCPRRCQHRALVTWRGLP